MILNCLLEIFLYKKRLIKISLEEPKFHTPHEKAMRWLRKNLSIFLEVKDDVITYPEITKKISTPRYPPGKISLFKWLIITDIIGIIEGIMILNKTPLQFKKTYIDKKTFWFQWLKKIKNWLQYHWFYQHL